MEQNFGSAAARAALDRLTRARIEQARWPSDGGAAASQPQDADGVEERAARRAWLILDLRRSECLFRVGSARSALAPKRKESRRPPALTRWRDRAKLTCALADLKAAEAALDRPGPSPEQAG